jgi:hypothetical protein
MKNILAGLIILSSLNAAADSGTLLNQAGGDIDLSSRITVQKQLTLDDPFVIQLYSAWKAMGALEASSNQWIELILDKKYEEALALLPSIKEAKLGNAKQATELYLLYRTGNIQTLFSQWISLSSSTNFLQTEFGIALDQIVGPKSTALIMEHGFNITPDLSLKLAKIESAPSKINYSLQALKALRTRENAVAWIGKLEEGNPLRMPLAQTALLYYAHEGKLGASGKIIKEVVEPILNKSASEEDLSLYFLTLGRLLYRAGAMAESQKYYSLIPETSSYFLKARTESLWAYLTAKDYSRTKGELATLELKIFNDKFYPEAYLVSAMANVTLCQFTDSRAAINRFIDVNRSWAKEIEKNLADPDAKPIEPSFFLTNLEKAKASVEKEKVNFENKKLNSNYIQSLNEASVAIDNSIKKEINSQWLNRKALLETALYKMKFVKIELISRMRQMEMNHNVAQVDEVSQQSAATARSRKNEMSFPQKGPLWGDELFRMSASVKNECVTKR